MITRHEGNLLNISAWILVGILGIVIVSNWGGWASSGPLLGLLLLFLVVMVRLPDENPAPRQIHFYLSIQTLIIALSLLEGGIFVFLFFILSAQAMMFLPSRAGLRWIAVFAVVTIIGNFYDDFNLWTDVINSLVNSAGFLFFGVFGNALMRAETARAESQRLLAELQEAHQQLQAYAGQVETLAVAEERNRLSREMHDTLGHRLTVSIVQLEGAGRLLDQDPERAGQMINTVRQQLVEGLEELRRTLAAIRNPIMGGASLSRSLITLTDDFAKATRIQVHRTLPNDLPSLSDMQRIAIYRTAQEALTNVQRHAQAQNVWLTLEQDHSTVHLTLRDDGQGMDGAHHAPGIGLRGMQERAAQLQGTLEIDTMPGQGTQIRLQLPVQQEKVYA